VPLCCAVLCADCKTNSVNNTDIHINAVLLNLQKLINYSLKFEPYIVVLYVITLHDLGGSGFYPQSQGYLLCTAEFPCCVQHCEACCRPAVAMLCYRVTDERRSDGRVFSFNMLALVDHLDKQSTQNRLASYFNVDTLKYRVSRSTMHHCFVLCQSVHLTCIGLGRAAACKAKARDFRDIVAVYLIYPN